MDILIALAVVASVALLAGVLLALISHFFGVEKSHELKAISACLPGVNCGACGYKGCDDYAAALAKREAAPNRCVPGGANTADALSELLGIEIERPKDVVAYVHCNGHCEAAGTKADYVGMAQCRSATMVYGGPKSCRFGCLGFGECAAVCPTHAICVKDGIAHVDPTRCIGCGLCKNICPKKIISLIPRNASVTVMCASKDKGAEARRACTNACIGCKKCVTTCPHGAISVVNNLAQIDYDKCTGCGVCVENCPTGCLKKLFTSASTQDVEAKE